MLADPHGDQRPEPQTTWTGSDEPAAAAAIGELAATIRTALAHDIETTPVNVRELAAGTIPGGAVICLLLAFTGRLPDWSPTRG